MDGKQRTRGGIIPSMNARPTWMLCLAILLAGMTVRAPAQPVPNSAALEDKISRSHDLDKFLSGVDPEQFFRQGLNKIRAREIILEDYKNKNGKEAKDVDELIRQNEEFVRKFLKEFRFSNLPKNLRTRFAGQQDELENFIKSLQPADLRKYAGMAEGLGTSGQGASPGGAQAGNSAAAPDAGSRPGSDDKGAEPVADPSLSGDDGEDQKANSVLGRWLLKAADRFKDLEPSLRNSPVLQNAMRELSRKVEGADERWKDLDKGANAIANKWARLGQALPFKRLWPENGLSWPHSLTPEALPNWHLPQSRPRFERPLPPTVPGGGLPEISARDGWRAFWMLAVLAVLGLVLWKVWVRSSAGGLRAGAGAWKLGPWPVQPTSVQTREELIRAFEYLSVLRLGPAARHWHHWAIASSLGHFPDNAVSDSRGGDGAAERRRAAEQLASLYERARYAPPSEPLPEAALSTARRDLCLLAGVPIS